MRRSGPLPSVGLAFLLTMSAGFPGLKPLAPEPSYQLMAMTELKSGSNGHYVVQAEINGSNVTVMVDTGATAVALSHEDAAALGLNPDELTYNVPVSTANGQAMAARISLDKVNIDQVKVYDVEALVMPQGALSGSLLGMSYLGRLQSFKVQDGVLVLKN